MKNYDEALRNFLIKLTEREKKHFFENFPNLTPRVFKVIYGRKFDRVIQVDSFNGEDQKSTRVFCFLNKETGGIIKAASWKAPEPKKREHGNIFADDPLAGTNEYGVNYLVDVYASLRK